jgi:nucleoside-diphosphate-sugar epimerase
MIDLDDLLSEPTPPVVEALSSLEGDIAILGAGGKMGPTLARLARRASDVAGASREVFAVSRFTEETIRGRLESWGVRTIQCDLLDRDDVGGLPHAQNVVFMAGRKFGSTGKESLTWAMNVLAPANVCEVFRSSRIVAFSTGNVYGLSPVTRGGAVETDPPDPRGDYALSCFGRERIFEHYCHLHGTSVAILRLNYACDLRYGVLVDLARKVWGGEVIDVSMGAFNTIWQGDANAVALRALSLASAPPLVLNLTGPEILSVREVSEELGRLLGKPVRIRGAEAPDAFLSNAEKAHRLFGLPSVNASELIRRVAEWVRRGGESIGKPTLYEVRDGKF